MDISRQAEYFIAFAKTSQKTNKARFFFFPARNSVLIIVFSKPDPERKSQPVNDLMLIFPSQRNYSLSSGFSVERLRQVLLFSMETPYWSASEGLQHGDRKPVETSGVYYGTFRTFILPVKLENIRIGTSLNILVTRNPKT